MASVSSYILDEALAILDLEATRLDLCDTEPTTFTEATVTYSLGNKTGIAVSAPTAHSPTGREVTVSAITDGEVTADGTAAFYAITDVSNSRLLITRALANPQAVTNGNTFSSLAFKVYFPGAV